MNDLNNQLKSAYAVCAPNINSALEIPGLDFKTIVAVVVKGNLEKAIREQIAAAKADGAPINSDTLVICVRKAPMRDGRAQARRFKGLVERYRFTPDDRGPAFLLLGKALASVISQENDLIGRVTTWNGGPQQKDEDQVKAFLAGPTDMLHFRSSDAKAPITSGKLYYKSIGDRYSHVQFKEPLKLEWFIESGDQKKVFLYWCFAHGDMMKLISLRMPKFAGIAKFRGSGKLPWMNGGAHATIERAIENHVEFEVMHSFFHTPEDPNYGVYNHAIYGCLKDNTIVFESEPEPTPKKNVTSK